MGAIGLSLEIPRSDSIATMGRSYAVPIPSFPLLIS